MDNLTYCVRLAGEGELIIRLLAPSDVDALTVLFESLSPDTRRRYGPHPFDRATAERLCSELDPSQSLRFVAQRADGALLAYMILQRQLWPDDIVRYEGWLFPESERACLAPVVADAYQNRGLGKLMARQVLAAASQVGIRQVVLMGGVQATNDRAYHFYRSLGFQPIGSFWTGSGDARMLNYAMIRNALS